MKNVIKGTSCNRSCRWLLQKLKLKTVLLSVLLLTALATISTVGAVPPPTVAVTTATTPTATVRTPRLSKTMSEDEVTESM